jgi:hypothetical protein
MIILIAIILCILLLGLVIFNKYLPVWFCHHFGWHLPPYIRAYSSWDYWYGICPRCGKTVIQDSQGNWF